jgi:hypothetical protein
MFRSGYVQVGSFRGAPIRLHWTVPILCVLVGGTRLAPGAWLAAFLVVLGHELGHAALAKRYKQDVIEVMVHALGGHCMYAGEQSPWQRSVIASGGVLAQLGMFLVASAWLAISPPVQSQFLMDALFVFTQINVSIALFNLVPIPPLDGAEIWKLPGLYLARRRRRRGMKSAQGALQTVVAKKAETRASTPRSATPGDVVEIDEAAVRETVRRALEEARKSSKH